MDAADWNYSCAKYLGLTPRETLSQLAINLLPLQSQNVRCVNKPCGGPSYILVFSVFRLLLDFQSFLENRIEILFKKIRKDSID